MRPANYPPTLVMTGMAALCAVLTLVLAMIAGSELSWAFLGLFCTVGLDECFRSSDASSPEDCFGEIRMVRTIGVGRALCRERDCQPGDSQRDPYRGEPVASHTGRTSSASSP